MCSVVGGRVTSEQGLKVLNRAWNRSVDRGRDAHGVALLRKDDWPRTYRGAGTGECGSLYRVLDQTGTWMINRRATPTTETDGPPDDHLQPLALYGLFATHNGTIANDREVRTFEHRTAIDSGAMVEVMQGVDLRSAHAVARALGRLQGSYAVAFVDQQNPDRIVLATNYKPLHYVELHDRWELVFSSLAHHLANEQEPLPVKEVPPYSVLVWEAGAGVVDEASLRTLRNDQEALHVLVVASGGLDSTVAATMMDRGGYEVNLLHVGYDCKAGGKENQAVQAISKRMGWPLHRLRTEMMAGLSPLTGEGDTIAAGVPGSEYAHEWVPARNLLFLSMATAYAEAHGFGQLVLGANLEESGAYPDNEMHFLNKFDDLLPYAVNEGKQVRMSLPVAHMMKHEIVSEGMRIGAPLDLTWSCYRGGERHCGQCGPCYMRRTAFARAGYSEVIEYEDVL